MLSASWIISGEGQSMLLRNYSMPKSSCLGHNLEVLQTRLSSFSGYVKYSHEFNNSESTDLTHAQEISATPVKQGINFTNY